MSDDALVAAAEAARASYGRLVALVASRCGDVVVAEDMVADAFERALRTWPRQGVPANPDGWLLTVARNRTRDRWRSAEVQRTVALDLPRHDAPRIDDVDPDAIPDRRLELMLVCAHPAIAPSDRTPLVLNTVLGFTAAEIGRAWAVPARTMATRLVRAKRRIARARIPFRIPEPTELAPRMDAVLQAVYGAYVIEWSTGGEPRELPSEARQLAEVLVAVAPDDDGRFVPLSEQDPSRWDQRLVQRAHEHLRAAHAHRTLGRFQLEAAIQAVHCVRGPGEAPDWTTLLALHRDLWSIAPTLGSTTALAAVVAEVEGPAAGLAVLDGLGDAAARFQPAWATRASLLHRAGDRARAVAAWARAIDLTHDPAARAHLQRLLDQAGRAPSFGQGSASGPRR